MEAFKGLKLESISVFNFQKEDYKEKRLENMQALEEAKK